MCARMHAYMHAHNPANECVLLCFACVSMFINVLLCHGLLREYSRIPCFSLIKLSSAYSYFFSINNYVFLSWSLLASYCCTAYFQQSPETDSTASLYMFWPAPQCWKEREKIQPSTLIPSHKTEYGKRQISGSQSLLRDPTICQSFQRRDCSVKTCNICLW